jgi:hypothetical protein
MKSPHGNESRATNLEKTIRDVLRSRNQIDAQFVNEAMKRYVVNIAKNFGLFYSYAKQFGFQKIVRRILNSFDKKIWTIE